MLSFRWAQWIIHCKSTIKKKNTGKYKLNTYDKRHSIKYTPVTYYTKHNNIDIDYV